VTGADWNPFFRHPRLALAITGLLVLPLLWHLTRLRVSSETGVLLQGDQRNLASYQQVRRILGDTEVVVLGLESEALFTPAGIDQVRRLSVAFEQQPDVVEVRSLTHSYKPVRRGLSFEMVPLVPDQPSPSALADLKTFCTTHPLVRNIMVSADGRHTLILATFRQRAETPAAQTALRARIDSLLARFQDEGARIQVLAIPFIEQEIRATLRTDLRRFIPAAGVILILVLWITLRSLPLVGFAVACHGLALLLVAGTIAIGGFRLNVFSIMLFPLLTGIHLTLLIHLLTSFQRMRATQPDPDTALRESLRVVFKPSAYATATTVVGLLSLTIGGAAPTREFGLLAAVGLTLVHGITFGPAIAALRCLAPRLALPRFRGGCLPWSCRFASAPGRWTGFIARHRRVILGSALAALALLSLGIGRIRTDVRAVEFLNPRSPTRQAFEALNRVYGGINVVQIEFDSGATNGVNHPAFLRYLEQVHRFAAARTNLSGVYSYPQLLAMMNQIWNHERPGSLVLPENPLLLQVFVFALRSYDFPFLVTLADPSFQTASLVLRTSDLSADRYVALVRDVVHYAERLRPPGTTVSAARGLHSLLEADRQILRSQTQSAVLTLAVIGLLLAGLWRSAALAGLVVLANTLPVAAVLATAGWADIPLNSITVMVAAIALGIAVDNGIHTVTFWRDQRRAGQSAHGAIERTLEAKGRPILGTEIILIAVFSLFGGSSFPPVVHFGMLAAIAFATALAAVLLVLPALLLTRAATPGSPQAGASPTPVPGSRR